MLAAFPLAKARADAGGATGAPWGRQTHQQVSLKECIIINIKGRFSQ